MIVSICLGLIAVCTLHAKGDEFIGDMLLTPEQRMFVETGKSARATVNRRWPNNTLPYVIDPSASGARSVIESAMKEWSEKTCIRFKPRTDEADFIRFFSGTGCWSRVGSLGGEQWLSLKDNGCWYHGIAVHEIGHALGFWHEQNRPDRDNYVTINYINIWSDRRLNFFKLKSTSTQTPYDYGSIMHYGPYDFSRNGELTIETKTKGVTIGQNKELSEMDTMQAQILYNCPAGGYTVSRLVCEDQFLALRCYGGRKIKITYANYGRQNMVKCGFFPWTLCSSDQIAKVGLLCNGKTVCVVGATNTAFGDPCPGASKYLEINFKCDP